MRFIRSDAYFSKDRKFRYWLLRVWDESLAIMGNVGANPSTAEEVVNDPTIRKDVGFAQRLGYGGLLKLNVGGYRATDPKKWYAAPDPYGPENSVAHLLEYLEKFKVNETALAWGKCVGRFRSRANAIAANIPNAMCFGKNSDGTPRHTLMLSYSTKLELYR